MPICVVWGLWPAQMACASLLLTASLTCDQSPVLCCCFAAYTCITSTPHNPVATSMRMSACWFQGLSNLLEQPPVTEYSMHCNVLRRNIVCRVVANPHVMSKSWLRHRWPSATLAPAFDICTVWMSSCLWLARHIISQLQEFAGQILPGCQSDVLEAQELKRVQHRI